MKVSRVYQEPPIFSQSDFGDNRAIIGFLMFSCGLLVRYHRVELKYGKNLPAGLGALSYGFSKFRKTESSVFLVLQLVMYSIMI